MEQENVSSGREVSGGKHGFRISVMIQNLERDQKKKKKDAKRQTMQEK